MLYSVIITVLIASAVIGIFCFRAVRLDKCRRRVKSFVLIPWREGTEDIELLVKSCYWEEVFSGSRCARDIILLIKDNELVPEKAKELELDFPIVHCVRSCGLESFLKER